MNSQPFGPWLAAAIFLALATFSVSLIPYFFPTAFTTFLEKWRSLNSLKKLALIGILIGVTAFAGTKPSSGDDDTSGGSSTNDVTIVEGDSTNDVVIIDGDCTNDVTVIEGNSTNDVAIIEGDPTNSVPDDASSPTNTPPPMMMQARPKMRNQVRPEVSFQQTEPDILCSPSPSAFTSITAWNKRGAYCDWVHITFPDDFAFPAGTNLLTGVTVMAYGELRETLHCSPSTSPFALPARVSLVPDESTFSYGLTPSNTFLFAWQNVCVERDATNRVDASIELFRNGACSVRFDTVETFYPALPPPGFVGQGQDAAWVAAAFSTTDYAAITNKGYDAWLMEDQVGINEQNGIYKATITVHSMPPNDEPCYLECGPYRVIVTEPGEYSFPLQVFTHYTARTYPTPVPLSVEYDDGYRGTPSLLGAPAPQNSAPRLMGFGLPLIVPLPIYLDASMHVWPSSIDLRYARNYVIEIWCNLPTAAQSVWESASGLTVLHFISPSLAEIDEVFDNDVVSFTRITGMGSCSGSVPITGAEYNHCCCCGNCSGENCSCGCDCPNHHVHDDGTNAPPQTGTQP